MDRGARQYGHTEPTFGSTGAPQLLQVTLSSYRLSLKLVSAPVTIA
jgi:hypothetical protein